MINRVILIVLDSVGIGELPDAGEYNDLGSNTLGNISKTVEDFKLDNLLKIGIGNIDSIKGIFPISSPIGNFGRCKEASKGKDTITGHWEISGIALDKPLKTFPNGFPKEIMDKFEKTICRKTLGNIVASGTQIIDDLGNEHVKTGYPIIYTSADSVFQIAAHEDIIPLNELYKMCEIAGNMLVDDWMVGRVIARPFIGKAGDFKRTSNRHDYALNPFGKTILNYISESGKDVLAVGKIEDIFNKNGITSSVHIKNNMDGVDKTLDYIKQKNSGLIFTNLVDFDMLYGHRNDPKGYAEALKDFDNRVPEIIENMNNDDLLIITADHGCDPTTASTDHSREYIPLLVYSKSIKSGVNLGTLPSFTDIGKTILDLLNIENNLLGNSFKEHII